MQTKDSKHDSLFSSFSEEHSHYKLLTALLYKTMLQSTGKKISFSYDFKRCSAENTTGMAVLAFHRISGHIEGDLFIPNSTEIGSLSCFDFAPEDWSCLPEEVFIGMSQWSSSGWSSEGRSCVTCRAASQGSKCWCEQVGTCTWFFSLNFTF